MAFLNKWFGNKKTILIIEDNEELSTLLAMFLKGKGFNILQAFDGVEGLKRVDANKPDLIILDVTMPKMDGFNVLMKLKTDPKTKFIPVFMCTDHNSISDVDKCCNWGAVGYILKPFELDKVYEKVTSGFSQK